MTKADKEPCPYCHTVNDECNEVWVDTTHGKLRIIGCRDVPDGQTWALADWPLKARN